MLRNIVVLILFLYGYRVDIVKGFSNERVLLTEIKVITLFYGKQTTSLRTESIPQLRCVGGTAGCSSFVPKVVQCYNKGTDGFDVQWECKTDMDNGYRFGKVEVSCEGYDYDLDPYILKGSCGVEYTIDFTEEGKQKQRNSRNYEHSAYTPIKPQSNGWSDLILLLVVGAIIYAIYKTCLGNTGTAGYGEEYDIPSQSRGTGSTDGTGYGYNSGYNSGYNQGYDNPYAGGSYSQRGGYYHGASCGSQYRSGMNGGGLGGNNFWTGAATGGLLGYMFGSRNSGYRRPHYGTNTWGGNSWGGNSWGSSGGSSFGSSGMGMSSGTRTASGFATTKRR